MCTPDSVVCCWCFSNEQVFSNPGKYEVSIWFRWDWLDRGLHGQRDTAVKRSEIFLKHLPEDCVLFLTGVPLAEENKASGVGVYRFSPVPHTPSPQKSGIERTLF